MKLKNSNSFLLQMPFSNNPGMSRKSEKFEVVAATQWVSVVQCCDWQKGAKLRFHQILRIITTGSGNKRVLSSPYQFTADLEWVGAWSLKVGALFSFFSCWPSPEQLAETSNVRRKNIGLKIPYMDSGSIHIGNGNFITMSNFAILSIDMAGLNLSDFWLFIPIPGSVVLFILLQGAPGAPGVDGDVGPAVSACWAYWQSSGLEFQ